MNNKYENGVEIIGSASNSAIDQKEQREQQVERNRAIGSGRDQDIPISEKITIENALNRFVYIVKGSRIADLKNISRDLRMDEFHNCYMSSEHLVVSSNTDAQGVERSTKTNKKVTGQWLKSDHRKEVFTRTFKAGDQLIVVDPDANVALNLWNGFRMHPEITTDDELLVEYFLCHCKIIFGDSTEKFLDWLAHIRQKPGVLPHYGWISIATNTGVGRNWMASALVRVFAGYVAASFDLPAMLESGFNGDLSRKILAIVDEIQEGGNGQWKHAEKLKSIVNQEYRTINPKCEPQHKEYNSCRWLVFSNHLNAIPLNETDRRFEVVITESQPQSEGYFKKMYALLDNQAFIASIALFLEQRNISGFNPGARPKMSEAKIRMIEESKSETQKLADEIVKYYPFDVITLDNIYQLLNTDHRDKSVRPVCDTAGMISYPKSIRISGSKHRCRIIRNHAKWLDATTEELRVEAQKLGFGEIASEVLITAMEVLIEVDI